VLKLTHVFQIHPVYVNFLIVKIVPNSSIVNWHFNPLSSVFTFFKHFQKVKKNSVGKWRPSISPDLVPVDFYFPHLDFTFVLYLMNESSVEISP
jgi:hypothetical protein